MAGYSLRLVRKGQDAPLLAGRRMGFFISLTLAVLCLGIALSAGTSAASGLRELPSSLHEDICGPISTDDTWTAAQSPFNVTCDTELLPGVTLEIEPGVEIRFAAGVGLTILGTLRCHRHASPAHHLHLRSGDTGTRRLGLASTL